MFFQLGVALTASTEQSENRGLRNSVCVSEYSITYIKVYVYKYIYNMHFKSFMSNSAGRAEQQLSVKVTCQSINTQHVICRVTSNKVIR